MQLSDEKSPGWEFSLSIFVGLNGIAFLFMIIAYVLMYRSIVRSSRATHSMRASQESTLAKRMVFIILTDLFCWFPVIVLSVLAITGKLHDPRKQVYVWIAVFVLPINSAINPVLYTFSTSFVRVRTANQNTKTVSGRGASVTQETGKPVAD